ncbi:MAG: glycosyltransferase [Desulfuromonadaceae bacterium]|nr:glycosyltransferase [Desulfuromonadaceae bacterium]
MVTFVLVTYNHEAFIREAVEGALAQTYSPLEIIISDDSSSDETFPIIEKVVKDYFGPHIIKLNRNEKNLGIALHASQLYEMAQGDIVIYAEGDDISLPDRTSKVVEAFTSGGDNPPSMVISNAIKIDGYGTELDLLTDGMNTVVWDKSINPLTNELSIVNGCTRNLHRSLIDAFPPMDSKIISGDVTSMQRAYLLNGVMYIPDVLVKYRIWTGGLSQLLDKSKNNYIQHNIKWCKERLLRFEQLLKDLSHVNYINSEDVLRTMYRDRGAVCRALKILNSNLLFSSMMLIQSFCVDLIYNRKINYFRGSARHFVVRWFPSLIGYYSI